jgi:hypothetical protein
MAREYSDNFMNDFDQWKYQQYEGNIMMNFREMTLRWMRLRPSILDKVLR